ncbi:MAG TPA: helix-turn-helix transcriptional regulator [Steroidobacteraceae bacterium]|nr:helix-turn-helix transcriptional regulator [Steroidobacteraceae bacterium]
MFDLHIEAQASCGVGRVEVVRRQWEQTIDIVGATDEHRVEFAMLPRSEAAAGCYPNHPRMHQFERFGEVFFFPAREVIHARSECRRQHSVVCSFRPEAVDEWFDSEFVWTDARLWSAFNINHPGIRYLLSRLGDEVRHPGMASDVMIELVTAQIGLELARYFNGIGKQPRTGGLSARNLRFIDDRLEQQGAPPSLTELAGLCGLSVRHLTRAFKESRRCSIGDYIAERRIDRVRDLLTSGSSVKAVAYTLGFSSPAALSSAFRRATGERPRDYLQRVRS